MWLLLRAKSMMLVMMTLSWWQKVDDERYHPLRMEGEQEAENSRIPR